MLHISRFFRSFEVNIAIRNDDEKAAGLADQRHTRRQAKRAAGTLAVTVQVVAPKGIYALLLEVITVSLIIISQHASRCCSKNSSLDFTSPSWDRLSGLITHERSR